MIQDVLRDSHIGLWCIEIDSGNRIRMYADDTFCEMMGIEKGMSPERRYQFWIGHVGENELDREIACEILKEEGFLIEEAENGVIAVEKLLHSAPGYYDIILMDVQMPILDGYKATREIRNLEQESLAAVPIVAMTANAFEEGRKKALEAGMNEHISKPIHIEKLRKVLAKVLRLGEGKA